MTRSTLTLLAILLTFSEMLAQSPLRFRNLSMLDGFAHNGTSFNQSIAKDSEGFVWFTTYNGMSRFDGVRFKNFRHDPNNPNSIPDNLLTVVHEGPEGQIWVGTPLKGIFIFNKKTEAFSSFKPVTDTGDRVLKAHIYFIKTDSKGDVWYGGENGVARWHKSNNKSDYFKGYFKTAQAFYQQSDGSFWIADNKGLHRQSPNNGAFECILSTKEVGGICDILEPKEGKLWLASPSKGLLELDARTLELTRLHNAYWYPPGYFPVCLRNGNRGDVWMASHSGILRYNLISGRSQYTYHNPLDPLSLPPDPEYILVDEFDNLFVNTGNHGMAYAHAGDHPFELIGNIKSIDFIVLDDHRFLIRDFKKGGIVYDTKKRQITDEKIPVGPGSVYLPSMAIRGDTQLWIWNAGNIQFYDLRTKVLKTAPKNPNHSLYVRLDRRGRVWNGVSYLDEKQNKWINTYPELQAAFPELDSVPFDYAILYFDRANRMYANIFGHDKVIRYDFEKKKGKIYPTDGLPIPGTGDRFYLSIPTGLGLYLPEKDSFQVLTEKDGLMHSSIFYVVDDARGRGWVATPKGLQMYDWEQKSFTTINLEDGFPGWGQTLVRMGTRDQQGNLYFDLNIEKIFRFHPDSLKPNTQTTPVYFTEFYQGLKTQTVGLKGSILQNSLCYMKSINLDYYQADFGFEFTMPCYYKSNQIEYFYELEPYHSDWQYNGTANVIHFTNIRPGRYTLRVKARTAAGVWSTQEAIIRIRVHPPWWKSWWASCLYVIFFLTAVYTIYRYNLKRQLDRKESERLKDLDSLKTRLYTNITHEFRTPLTVIMGIADTLDQHPSERNLIRRNSKNLLRLINQLLDLSKLDSGTMQMDMVQGDVINYLKYLVESFYSMAVEKRIALRFESDLEKLIMDFDEVKIQHIVYNLLSNALKFTPGKGEIVVSAERRNDQLILKVRDSGIGISEEQLPRIFDRFYQADSSTTRKGEGTGIGLALSRELLQMMGGEISAKSRLGEGSEFTILLPVKKASGTTPLNVDLSTGKAEQPGEDKTSLQTGTVETGKNESAGIEKPHLLLLEDNKDVATFIQTLLRSDYHITWADNGQKGIDIAFEQVPDIVISDVMMPERDGFEVCAALKQNMLTSHIPIVLLTAKAQQKDKVEGLKFGADAYLIKPFDKEELYVRLEKLLELRRKLREKYAGAPVPERASPEPTLEEKFLQKLHEAALSVIDSPETAITQLERAMHLSQMQLYRKLRALTGKTPSLYLRSVRLYKAKELLQTTDLTVSEIAYHVGFTDPSYLSRAFNEEFGIPPTGLRS